MYALSPLLKANLTSLKITGPYKGAGYHHHRFIQIKITRKDMYRLKSHYQLLTRTLVFHCVSQYVAACFHTLARHAQRASTFNDNYINKLDTFDES